MRPSSAIACGLALALLAGGCSRLTFIKPSMGSGDYERTAPTYELRDSPEVKQRANVRGHLALATNALQKGLLDEAEKEARAALKIDGKSADANTLLAVVEDQRGNREQAGGYYARAAELAPEQGTALNNYGAWLCGNGRAAESLPWFDKALADPMYRQRASALANSGSCALKAGQTARVEDRLRQALALDPVDATALEAMAEYQYRSGRYMDARAFSERRLGAAPATRSVLLLASQIEDKLGDRAAAARYVQRLRTEFPQTGTVQSGESSQP
ncbi:type IV pilus biogenesis/stability protein PilW [Luteimonas lutimaris]|uniref:Type IV pilus biogenesis/stability protein PilW n=1 Tax=Luteimonas lutimaris TaxID=698645 RepID=A0ABP7MAB2_9GAMM